MTSNRRRCFVLNSLARSLRPPRERPPRERPPRERPPRERPPRERGHLARFCFPDRGNEQEVSCRHRQLKPLASLALLSLLCLQLLGCPYGQARDTGREFQKELLAQAQKSSVPIPANTASDYADSLGARADYWHPEKMPLKIFILEDLKVPDYKPQLKDYFLNSCKSWQDAAQGKIQFKFVEKEPSDIKVSWTNDISQVRQKGELGEAAWENDQDGLYRATIKLLTVNQDGSRGISPQEAKAMCLHEIGHALGLAQHSPYLGDIMNACIDINFRTPVEMIDLSQRDKKTIVRLYSEGDTLLNQLAETSSDTKAKLVRICFQAARFLKQENYDQAYELLAKALAIDPSCSQALYDMSTCCFEQGMDSYANGDYAKAVRRLEKFLSVCESIKMNGDQLTEAQQTLAKCKEKLSPASKAK